MADTNLTQLKKRRAGTQANDIGGTDTINQETDFYYVHRKAAADSMAADATTSTKIWTNPFDFPVEVVSAKANGDAGLTAHDTNYAQIKIETDDGANSAPATALQWDTTLTGGTGTWSTDVSKDVTTRTAANATVAAGANLWFAIAKQGSGVVVPASSYSIRLRRK